ncbi:2-dehydro-3-deoxygalactonokinase [Enterovibrio calviensis]|uniref:2-dehydro-3-deoxygalactonokinase n=1 Tax=Enterovibrio calviensis TaxID=91359 RepID=UPI0004852C93|nr:2-dehydro-3-deoxygalactonokinase [Enterovibrio calviensis]
MLILTIDTGTTNTRVRLWRGEQLVDIEKAPVGVKNTSIDGNTTAITDAIRHAIEAILQRHQLSESDIGLTLASGMISSKLGLVDVAHVPAPVNREKLARNVVKRVIPEINPLLIYFIPGVKNTVSEDAGSWAQMDMMRGEEVEAFAAMRFIPKGQSAVIALPGSHTKFVFIDSDQNITGCSTTLTGELTAAVTFHTILSTSLQARFTETIDTQCLFDGAKSAQKVGITKTLFSLRIREQFYGLSQEELASFLMGAIAASDIKSLLTSTYFSEELPPSIYVVGQTPAANALFFLLKELHPERTTKQLTHSEVSHLSGLGCIEIAQAGKLIE